jgi:hypothetical protein
MERGDALEGGVDAVEKLPGDADPTEIWMESLQESNLVGEEWVLKPE